MVTILEQQRLALVGGPPTVTAPRPRWPMIGEEEIAAVVKVLLTENISQVGRGGIVAQFEDEFAAYMGARFALSFSSGTSALHGAVFAAGGGPGFEVLTPAYTWISAITAILHANATPVFCDVQPGGYHIDPEEIRRKATPRTKAVIVCHTWGLPADMDAILEVAREKQLVVIEDCSHAHGGTYRGRKLGTIGDIGCFSLQGSKSMVAGEGGVLVTSDRLRYERAMVPGHHDVRLHQELTLPDTVPFQMGGGYWKYRAVPVSMAIAHAQLHHLDEWNAAREENYRRLKAQLTDLPFLRFPDLPPDSARGFYSCPCRYTYDQGEVSRDLFAEALRAEGAAVGTDYANWHRMPLLTDLSLFRQLWWDAYPNGARFVPAAPDALPQTDLIRGSNLLFPTWAIPAAELVDQYAAAVHKVAEQLPALAALQAQRLQSQAGGDFVATDHHPRG